jgi:multiple sugar transport system substrate-binding protein
MFRSPASYTRVPLTVLSLLAITLIAFGCGSGGDQGKKTEDGRTIVVFKHGKVAGGEALMNRIIQRFEEDNPDIKIVDEQLPPNTDQQHQFYVTNLEAGSADFDVFGLDVIWTPEFSRAGWLLDLSDVIDEVDREDFLEGPIRANTYEGKLYAAPWYVDGGVLYYRKDLLEKYGIAPPMTFDELATSAQFILSREKDPDLHGFIWQGKQYEGLVCAAMEFIYGNGAQVLDGNAAALDSPQAVAAIDWMRKLIEVGITPELVTTADEEATRNIFGSGRAIYMRNWPYAWNIFQRDESPVKDKIGITAMPHFPAGESASTLGGWQLGINKHSRSPEAAKRFIRFMVSPDTQEELAIAVGYKPSRRSVYYRPEIREEQPFIVELLSVMERTQPRPVTPYYPRITQILQTEFSAVVSGIRPAEEAMKSAAKEINKILESAEG